jgi:hypothetical protein
MGIGEPTFGNLFECRKPKVLGARFPRPVPSTGD